MTVIEKIINDVITVEGGYSNHINDSGGETNFGITKTVARENGYTGHMLNMPKTVAEAIYYKRYITEPKFDKVLLISRKIGEELIDTGVNCGVAVASRFLQEALNSFNKRGSLYPDVIVDGALGDKTFTALSSYLKHRGAIQGERVMLKALNCLQGARYIQLGVLNQKNEDFTYGWIDNRITL